MEFNSGFKGLKKNNLKNLVLDKGNLQEYPCFLLHSKFLCVHHQHETQQNCWICIHVRQLCNKTFPTRIMKQDLMLGTCTIMGYMS